MFNRYRTTGIFISSVDRGESNRFLTAYTKEFGKIKLFAKSIRKEESKLRFGADLFFLNEIEFIEGKNYRTLTDIKIIKDWKEIKKRLNVISFAYRACEYLDLFLREDEKDDKIWFLFQDFFEKINEEKKPSLIFLDYYYFIWKLIFFLGYKPELYYCACCSKKLEKKSIYFSFFLGGIMSSCCDGDKRNSLKISENTVKILRFFFEKDKIDFSKIKIDSETKNNLKIFTEKYLDYLKS